MLYLCAILFFTKAQQINQNNSGMETVFLEKMETPPENYFPRKMNESAISEVQNPLSDVFEYENHVFSHRNQMIYT